VYDEAGSRLGRDRIGVHDDFLELGGGSLLAVRILARLDRLLPVSLSLGSFLDHPTIAEQAALIDRELLIGDEATRLLAEVEALPDEDDAPVGRRERRARRRPGRVTDHLSSRLERLSREKRALLERLLLRRPRASAAPAGIPPRGPSRPCPLSPLQERIWFLAPDPLASPRGPVEEAVT
jgi:hypothetical protein